MKAPRDITYYAAGQNLMWDLHPCYECMGRGEYEVDSPKGGFITRCERCDGRGHLLNFKAKRRFIIKRKVAA